MHAYSRGEYNSFFHVFELLIATVYCIEQIRNVFISAINLLVLRDLSIQTM